MADPWSSFFYYENQEKHGESKLNPEECILNSVYLASVR